MLIRLSGWRCEVWQPDLYFQGPNNGKRKLAPTSCPLASKHGHGTYPARQICTYTCTQWANQLYKNTKRITFWVSPYYQLCVHVCVEARGWLLGVIPWTVGAELGFPGLLSKCLYPPSHPTHQHYALIWNLGEFKETKINTKRNIDIREQEQKKIWSSFSLVSTLVF